MTKVWATIVLTLVLMLPLVAIPTMANQIQHPQLLNSTMTTVLRDPFVTYNGFYSFEAYQPLPPGKPMVIPIITNAVFPYDLNNAYAVAPQNATVCIPPGSYSMIILNVTITETGGPQYDRALYIFANGVPVFWGSTQEILNSTAWSDLTIFENMLVGSCVKFQVILPNWIVPSIGVTGYYILNATLYLYKGPAPPNLPNYFIPIAPNAYGVSLIGLNPFHDNVTYSINLPRGTYRAVLLMYTEGGELDEFWYTNEPATRSLLVYYNGYLAAVFNPFETIYTGGIDPFMWKPMPSINTLSFHNPYVADITPLLATGLNGTLSITMTNLYEAYQLVGLPYFTWTVSGVLMLWVNNSNPLISGKLIMAQSSFFDSGPIFSTTPTGLTQYVEYGNYSINYVAVLMYRYGSEMAHTEQSGVFNAFQLFNAVMEYGTLSENFTETAQETLPGGEVFTSSFAGKYPIVFNVTAYITPLGPTTKYPYPAAYVQYATVNLTMMAHEEGSTPGMAYKSDIGEALNSYGFMNLSLLIINPYGGAVVTGISGNYARTSKDLVSVVTYSSPVGIPGWLEQFRALAVSPNATDLIGYYQYVILRLMRVGW
jgi:hypothetical protein